MIVLRELNLNDEVSFSSLLDDWDDAEGFNMLFGLIEGLSFQSFIDLCQEMKKEDPLMPKRVPVTSLYAFEGNVIVGKVSIRHRLNEKLLNVGGNIGYGVLPQYRGRGVASEILSQALEYCRALNLDKVLITCDEKNEASKKVIVKNGGVLKDYFQSQSTHHRKCRFWIEV